MKINKQQIENIRELTQTNNHTGARLYLAKLLGSKNHIKFYSAISDIQSIYGYKHFYLSQIFSEMETPFMRYLKHTLDNYDEVYRAL